MLKERTVRMVLTQLVCFVFALGIIHCSSLNVCAAAGDLVIAGTEQDSDSDCFGEGWSYTASTHTLTLDGFNFTYTGDDDSIKAISYSGSEALIIVITGENSIAGTFEGISSSKDITLNGNGSLKLNAKGFAIMCANLLVEGGDISLTGEYDGIDARSVTINGGNFKSVGTCCNGMQVVGEKAFVKINGGNVIAEGQSSGSGDMSSGIYCYDFERSGKGDVTIGAGSTVVARAGTNVAEQEEYVAIYGIVKNDIAGKGWADFEGTGNATDIAVNATSAQLTYKRVQFPAEIKVAITSVTLNKTTLALTVGGNETLNATIVPADATDKAVAWSSNNTAIANVDNAGKVTAVSAGKATITAKAGDKTASCEVTVTAAASGDNGNGGATGNGTDDKVGTPAAMGTPVTDTATGAIYVVTSEAGTEPVVEYTGTGGTSAATVTVPDTVTVGGVTYKVTAVAAKAFKNNKAITKVTISANITKIGAQAFAGCKKLKTVTIGKNITEIGTKAFANCTALTTITLPANVTKIGTQTFTGCKKLQTITIKSTKLTNKSISKNAFKGVGNKVTIKVPKSKKKAYTTLFRKKGLSKKVKIK